MIRSRKNILIELIVVAVLIMILIGVSLPRFFRAQSSATVVQAMRDMNALHKAFETYFADNKAYPPDFDSGQIPGANVMTMMSEAQTYKCLTTSVSYIHPVPFDVFQLEPGAVQVKNPPHYEYAGPGTVLIQSWALSGTKWTMVSIGPDLMSDGLWGYPPDRAHFLIFHTSNGLLSRGDIYASNHGVINPMN